MEEDFNPIRDLRSPEVDPFNVPVGQSTQEIEAIRLTLVVTREKTENLVKLLKRKGLLFKRDVEKIKELQRRLRKTIPRIPILRDDSITETETSMADSRSSRFDIRGFNRPQKPTTGDPVPVDKPSFPFLDVVISAVLIYFLGRGAGGPIKNFFNRFGKNKTKAPTIGDKLAEELARRIKELQDQGKKVPERILKLQKDLNRFLKNEKIANSMKANKNAKITNNIIKENRAFIKAEKSTISDSLAFTKRMVQEDLVSNTPINAFENLQVARATFTSRIEGLENAIQLGGLPKSRVRAIREVIKELKKANKEIDDISQKIADDIPNILEQLEKKGEFFDKLSGQSKLSKEQIQQLFEMMKVKPPGKASIDGKSMSNDIAMLNTDTRDREITVILTDSIA